MRTPVGDGRPGRRSEVPAYGRGRSAAAAPAQSQERKGTTKNGVRWRRSGSDGARAPGERRRRPRRCSRGRRGRRGGRPTTRMRARRGAGSAQVVGPKGLANTHGSCRRTQRVCLTRVISACGGLSRKTPWGPLDKVINAVPRGRRVPRRPKLKRGRLRLNNGRKRLPSFRDIHRDAATTIHREATDDRPGDVPRAAVGLNHERRGVTAIPGPFRNLLVMGGLPVYPGTPDSLRPGR